MIRVTGIELSLTDHCNLKCQACNHASPHLPEHINEVATIRRDLAALRGVLACDEIRLTGGEPFLNPELLEIVRVARDAGVAGRITLITNGLLLHRAPAALWDMIDCLCISIYPGVKHRWRYEDIETRCRDQGVRLWAKWTPTFQLSMVNQRIPDCLARFVYRHCSVAHEWNCHLVHTGRFYKCSTSAFMQERLNRRGIEFSNKEHDSVPLHDNPSLREDLKAHLGNRKSPLQACSYCVGTLGKSVPNRQLNAAGRRAELEQSDDRITSLLGVKGIVRSLLVRPVRQSKIFWILKDLKKYRHP